MTYRYAYSISTQQADGTPPPHLAIRGDQQRRTGQHGGYRTSLRRLLTLGLGIAISAYMHVGFARTSTTLDAVAAVTAPASDIADPIAAPNASIASAPALSKSQQRPSRRQILAGIVEKCGLTPDHKPCLIYDTAHDDVLLKDIQGQAQFLLMPISSISGIEDPAVLRPNVPAYFYQAWNRRGYVIAALGKPLRDNEIGLAINPINARSQDHLHIHIDCVRADVRDALAATSISAKWSDWQFGGSRWKVRRLPIEVFRTDNLFARVAREVPGAADDMGHQTIFVTGVPSAVEDLPDAGDVYIAVRRVRFPFFGGPNAERLLDQRCGVLSQGARPSGH